MLAVQGLSVNHSSPIPHHGDKSYRVLFDAPVFHHRRSSFSGRCLIADNRTLGRRTSRQRRHFTVCLETFENPSLQSLLSQIRCSSRAMTSTFRTLSSIFFYLLTYLLAYKSRPILHQLDTTRHARQTVSNASKTRSAVDPCRYRRYFDLQDIGIWP